MVRLLARVIGVGVETADICWLQEGTCREACATDGAVARLCRPHGLARRERQKNRREKGLTRSGNARVRRGMIQLAWRFLMFQKDSTLAQWFRARTESRPRHSQDHDRGLGAQATDRPVASRAGGRGAGRRRSCGGRHNERRSLKDTQQFSAPVRPHW